MKLLNKLPLPLAGLALALASYGNLFTDTAPTVKLILGVIAAVIIILLLLKVALKPASLAEGLSNPALAGTLLTYPMAVMVLASYLLPTNPAIAKVIWLIGLVMFVILLIVFFTKYILKFDIKKVFASYFVAFVGIVVASLASKPMGFQWLGQLVFWFGLAAMLLLLLPISYRYLRIKNVPPPARPAVTIYAAPASLLLAGYLSAFDTKLPWLAYGLFIIAVILTLVGLINTLPQLKGPFFPSMAAFTFPFVISAVATKMMNGYLTAASKPNVFVAGLYQFELVLAGLMLVYVASRYLAFFFKPSA